MMNSNMAPTRSNLMKLNENLSFAKLGYELLDQKRSILVIELLTLVDQTVEYQTKVEDALREARRTLEESIMQIGKLRVSSLAGAINMDYDINLTQRKVMGVSLPVVDTSFNDHGPYFSSESANILSEVSIEKFRDALSLMGKLAEMKVSIMRLAHEVKKTIRKVNALEKVSIPETEEMIHFMKARIEEAERESFILMKNVKDKLESRKNQKEDDSDMIMAYVVEK